MRSTLSRGVKLLAALTATLSLAAACGGNDSSSSASASSSSSSSATSSTSTGAGEPLKAAFIYVGPINDGGWSQAHEEGRQQAQAAMGDKVITTYKESVPEGPELTQTIEDLIKDGNKIIFATSFGFGESLPALADKYPDVVFEHATGLESSERIATYFGASEDTIYLTGLAAGAASKNGKIGFVAPFPIPEVIRHINGFAIGVREVNPDATVQVVWTNTWFNPADERKAADSLVAAGVDVLASGQDSPATGEAAKAANLPFVGYDSDQSENYPEIWLTASLYNWGDYYAQRMQAVIDGTWKTHDYYGTIADGLVSLAPFGKIVSEETRALIEQRQAEIAAGTFHEFTGPLKDQDGTERLPAGQRSTMQELLEMDWFVDNIIGSAKG